MSDTVTVSVQLPKLPEGWEYTGEYRAIRLGDFWRVYSGGVEHAVGDLADYDELGFIVRRIQPVTKTETLTLPCGCAWFFTRNPDGTVATFGGGHCSTKGMVLQAGVG